MSGVGGPAHALSAAPTVRGENRGSGVDGGQEVAGVGVVAHLGHSAVGADAPQLQLVVVDHVP